MITEPSRAEYDRYFELSNQCDVEHTAAEYAELKMLHGRVDPWLHSIEYNNLRLDYSGLIVVPESIDSKVTHRQWITGRLAVIPQHHVREMDNDIRLRWAILPFDEQPTETCLLECKDGRFQRGLPPNFEPLAMRDLVGFRVEFGVVVGRCLGAAGA